MAAETNQDSALERFRAARARRKAEALRDAADRRSALIRGIGLGGVTGGILGTAAHRYLGASVPVAAAGGTALGIGAGALIHRDARNRQHRDFLFGGGLHNAQSSMITGLGRRDGQSYIRFNTGNIYKYPDMTEDEHSRLEAAESLGKHFNAVLRARTAERVAQPRARYGNITIH